MLVTVAAAAGAWAAPEPLWIDTDAACGSGAFADADDCWALALALRSDEVAVRGISAVSGAVKAGEAARLAGEVARRFGHDGEVHQGAVRKNHRPTAASRALAAALERERLSIVALGPLTNIAALLLNRPDLAARIARVVAVFGTPPGIAAADRLTDYRNYNAAADTKSVAALMRAEVELVVVPLDAGRAAVLTDAALDRRRRRRRRSGVAGGGEPRLAARLARPYRRGRSVPGRRHRGRLPDRPRAARLPAHPRALRLEALLLPREQRHGHRRRRRGGAPDRLLRRRGRRVPGASARRRRRRRRLVTRAAGAGAHTRTSARRAQP